MTFPSLWLAIGGILATGMLLSGLQALARRMAAKRATNISPIPALLGGILSFLASAWMFFSLTGNFPWSLLVGGVIMTVIGGVIVFLIYGAAGLLHPYRDRDNVTLARAFLKPLQQGIAAIPVLLAIYVTPFVILYLAFQKANDVDLGTREGLFEIGLLQLTIMTGVTFALTNLINGLILLSKETSRQQRIQVLAQSFRNYLISAWVAGYPFYAFRFDELSNQRLFVVVGAALYLLAFLTFVLVPYLIGRTRYQAHKNKVLQKVSDECRRMSIATDLGVADSYRQKAMDRVFGNIRIILDGMGKDRPYFKYMTPHAAALFSSGPSGSLAAPEAPASSDVSVIDQGGTALPVVQHEHQQQAPAPGPNPLEEVQYLDYRLFVLAAAERLTTYRDHPATVRGVAAEIAVDCDRWLQTKEGRSGALAFMGVVISALLPIVFQYYGDGLRTIFERVNVFSAFQP